LYIPSKLFTLDGDYKRRSIGGDMQGIALKDYTDIFIQRLPRYIIKNHGKWKTKKQPLHDNLILAHLTGQLTIGTLPTWYPEYAIIDIDDRNYNDVESIRHDLCLNENNSFLCASESPNSYHIIFNPIYRGKPASLNLLNTIIKPYAKSRGVELYPTPGECVRLPFGKFQHIYDSDYAHLDDWTDKLY